jgi:plasmid maintenance system antidote protein VapI
MNTIKPIHAGEIFLEEFMLPFGLSQKCVGKIFTCSTSKNQ